MSHSRQGALPCLALGFLVPGLSVVAPGVSCDYAQRLNSRLRSRSSFNLPCCPLSPRQNVSILKGLLASGRIYTVTWPGVDPSYHQSPLFSLCSVIIHGQTLLTFQQPDSTRLADCAPWWLSAPACSCLTTISTRLDSFDRQLIRIAPRVSSQPTSAWPYHGLPSSLAHCSSSPAASFNPSSRRCPSVVSWSSFTHCRWSDALISSLHGRILKAIGNSTYSGRNHVSRRGTLCLLDLHCFSCDIQGCSLGSVLLHRPIGVFFSTLPHVLGV